MAEPNIKPPKGQKVEQNQVVGKPPLMPIASILSAIGEYAPSPVPRFMDKIERTAEEFLTNPGTGRLGMARGPWTSKLPTETVTLIRRLHEDGMSLRNIASRVGLSVNGVRNALHQRGISTTRPTVSGRINEINQLRARGDSIESIANQLGVTRYHVYRVLRNQGQGIRESNQVGRDPGLASMIRDTENRLINSGHTPEQISRHLNEVYDAQTTPQQVQSGGWWRLKGPTPSRRNVNELPPSAQDSAMSLEGSLLEHSGDHNVHSLPGLFEPRGLGSGFGNLNPATREMRWPQNIEDQMPGSASRFTKTNDNPDPNTGRNTYWNPPFDVNSIFGSIGKPPNIREGFPPTMNITNYGRQPGERHIGGREPVRRPINTIGPEQFTPRVNTFNIDVERAMAPLEGPPPGTRTLTRANDQPGDDVQRMEYLRAIMRQIFGK